MPTSEVEKLKTNNEIVKKAHLKWLSRAKTAKIDGIELTVLPYGFLSQAIAQALEEKDRETAERDYE